eukprot:GHRQ01000706.1.p1 GENE.GHRQ01000706.1~~GHRQ01000706.1.p1  ORF type:complete len:347 (+),score=146.11 GHRQ01000706.1:193-1233(+)
MTVTRHSDPLEMSRDAARAGGLASSKPGSQQDFSGRQFNSEAHPGLAPEQDMSKLGQHINPRAQAGGVQAPAGEGFMDMRGVPVQRSAAGSAQMSPEGMAQTALRQGQQGQQTAEKLARGIIAISGMSAASINKTATAVAGAIGSYTDNLMSHTPPLSQPLTVSSSYLNRLHLIQKFTQPAAYAADLGAQYAGELLYYMVQGAWAVYCQLAAMKVLPQLTSGSKTDATGVPVNPVRGGLPMATDELAAFKLVGSALLMAYVEVYDALEEAAQVLFRQSSSAGQRYLAHRHGGEAADVAAAALAVMADAMSLLLNWFRVLGRGLLSKTASGSARSYLLQQLPDLHLD